MLSRLLPLLLLFSALELAIFISLTVTIGFLYTLLLVLLLSYLGFLFKRLCRRYPQILLSKAAKKDPLAAMSETVTINIAYAFLIIPTFITKFFAIFLFIPSIRRWAINRVMNSSAAFKIFSKDTKTFTLDPDDYKNIN